jgi:hypothetical protein
LAGSRYSWTVELGEREAMAPTGSALARGEVVAP